ncbi:SymE family type I addiction module toxin [Erwinia sp. ErVv1]|uniref:SymE family type I addiction module toxin n=1 Tax=Erwinia sp. ErVv1 TaxID=1603299 RepID=UPI000832A39A|nr:SymE family type I addiction module toxin [Erwinia sp. ErVv1]
MAAQHHKSEQVSTKARRYTMGYGRVHIKLQPSPSITLRGHWMGALGFETGRKIEVICEQGELIIRLAEE